MTEGNWKKITMPDGEDEVSELAQAYNIMSEAVHSRETELIANEERLRLHAGFTRWCLGL